MNDVTGSTIKLWIYSYIACKGVGGRHDYLRPTVVYPRRVYQKVRGLQKHDVQSVQNNDDAR